MVRPLKSTAETRCVLRQSIAQEISRIGEMLIFKFFRKYHEDKSNGPRLRLGLFFLVCRFKSIARCSSRHPRLGDFLSLIKEAMSITAIAFVLIILLLVSIRPGTSRPTGNAIGYATHCKRSHDAVNRVYDTVGNVIEIARAQGRFQRAAQKKSRHL